MATGAALEDRTAVLRDALSALEGWESALPRISGADLATLVTLCDTLSASAAQARTLTVSEAVRRGEIDSTLPGWVREHAPSLRQGGAQQTSRLVTEATKGGALWSEQITPDPESPIGIVWAATTQRALTPANGLAVLAEMRHLTPRLCPEAIPTVTRTLVDLALEWGPAHMRRLRPRLLAQYGLTEELDDLHEKLARAAYLSSPTIESGDLTEYRMALTPTQAATLEAALAPLTAPMPNPETGEKDTRPVGQRRVEALIDICRRALATDLEGGGQGPSGAYAALHLTMSLQDLRALTGCVEALAGSHLSITPDAAGLFSGDVLASTAEGTLLSPEMLRQVACHAHLIPHVLGPAGELLDQGREVRLFNRAQRRRLLRRDRHCTYPGCDRPASWTRAHHVLHWWDGGTSDVSNGALLCERHHTIVHARRLWAEVRECPDEQGRSVIWDLVDGSYDRELARRRAERAAHDPPPLTPARIAELTRALAGADGDERAWAAQLTAWYEPADDEDWAVLDPQVWDEEGELSPPAA